MNKLTGAHVALIIVGAIIADNIVKNVCTLMAYRTQMKAVETMGPQEETIEIKTETEEA